MNPLTLTAKIAHKSGKNQTTVLINSLSNLGLMASIRLALAKSKAKIDTLILKKLTKQMRVIRVCSVKAKSHLLHSVMVDLVRLPLGRSRSFFGDSINLIKSATLKIDTLLADLLILKEA